jgi:hypothetical protein
LALSLATSLINLVVSSSAFRNLFCASCLWSALLFEGVRGFGEGPARAGRLRLRDLTGVVAVLTVAPFLARSSSAICLLTLLAVTRPTPPAASAARSLFLSARSSAMILLRFWLFDITFC